MTYTTKWTSITTYVDADTGEELQKLNETVYYIVKQLEKIIIYETKQIRYTKLIRRRPQQAELYRTNRKN